MQVDKHNFNFQKGIEEFRLMHKLPAVYPEARKLVEKEHPFWIITKKDTFLETLNAEDKNKYLKIFGEPSS
jgi:hypothetical protein